jgi:hypothetical protein
MPLCSSSVTVETYEDGHVSIDDPVCWNDCEDRGPCRLVVLTEWYRVNEQGKLAPMDDPSEEARVTAPKAVDYFLCQCDLRTGEDPQEELRQILRRRLGPCTAVKLVVRTLKAPDTPSFETFLACVGGDCPVGEQCVPVGSPSRHDPNVTTYVCRCGEPATPAIDEH